MILFKKKQDQSESMKKLPVLLVAAIMCVVLAACGHKTPQEIVLKALDVDVSGGAEISYEDTHGGFPADGKTSIILQFNDNSVLDAIKKDPKWKVFPLDETTQALVYGLENDASQTGPFLSNGDGNLMVPEIQNGYYILIDRHSEKDKNILERYSFNFTVGLYDVDTNIMYFFKLDT